MTAAALSAAVSARQPSTRRRRGITVAGLLVLAGLPGCEPVAPQPPAPVMRMVAVGDFHSCALSEEGTVWCWGDGSAGQLGTGALTAEATPGTVSTDQTFVSVVAGGRHTCALTGSGRAYCWGDNARGQVGMSNADLVVAPTPIGEDDLVFVELSAGWEHTCGITADGRAFCWGRGSEGQLGTGTRQDERAPALVLGDGSFSFISAGGRHTCGGGADGIVYCWGANDVAQLGIGEAGESAADPVPVSTSVRFIQVAAGFGHTCGIAVDRLVYCWGENGHGELGNSAAYEPGLPAETRPVPIFGPVTYATLSAGRSYTCGVRLQGEAMCWGRGSSGQLGNAQLEDHAVQQLVVPAPGVSFVPFTGPYVTLDAGGTSHTCGVTGDGTVLCWGSGAHGQLGYPEWLSMVPQRVRFPL